MKLFVDPSLYQNNSARYISREMEEKMGKFVQKETKIKETQVSLQSPEMLGKLTMQ